MALLFSVVVPTYNRLPMLKRALESVQTQTYSHWELIVVDDGSTDGTPNYLADLQKKELRFKPIFLAENRGVSHARNQGLKFATGDYVAFLDSDDRWKKEKLEIYQTRIKEPIEFPFWLHSNEIWYRSGQLLSQKKNHAKAGGWQFARSTELCVISPSSVCINREWLIEEGGFDENFVVCEDYDLWLRLSLKHPIYFIPDVLTEKYGGHADQLSHSQYGMDELRIKALLKHIDTKMPWYWKSVLVNQIKHKRDVLLKGAKKHNNVRIIKYCEDIQLLIKGAEATLLTSKIIRPQ